MSNLVHRLAARFSRHSQGATRRKASRRSTIETLETRALLASIDFVSGDVTGTGSYNFHLDAIVGGRPAVDYSASGTILPQSETPSHYDLIINTPPIGAPYANSVPWPVTEAYTQGTSKNIFLRSQIRATSIWDATAHASFSAATPGLIRYRINPTHSNEEVGERVRLSFSMDFLPYDSDGDLNYAISYRIGNGSNVRSEESFVGTVSLFDRITRDIEIDAQIGDEIEIGVNYNVSTEGSAYVDFNAKFGLVPTVNISPVYDSRFESGEFIFGYEVQHEALTANTELAFYWMNDEGWESTPLSKEFTPADALGPAFYHYSIFSANQKTIGTHYASLPLSEFPAAPSDATWLVIVDDPLDTVEEFEEGYSSFMVHVTTGTLFGFDHRNESNLDQVAVGYWPGTFPHSGGFEFVFYGIPDLDYENLGYNLSSEEDFHAIFDQYAQPLEHSVQVSQQGIDNNPRLELEDEDSDQALDAKNSHRLLINVDGTPLGHALEDPSWEAIIVQADFGPTFDGQPLPSLLANTRNFAGFYQADAGRRAVARAPLGQVDVVNISASGTVDMSGEAFATFSSPSEILILTADKNDRVTVAPAATIPMHIKGGMGKDVILGGAGNDVLVGGYGNDTMLGGLGDDIYFLGAATAAEADIVTESVNGGTDTLNFAALTTNISVRLDSTAIQAVDFNRTLKLNSTATFESVIGGSGNDTLIGNALNNFLTGNAGNDTIYGLQGNDTIYGLQGSDTVLGGLGDDTYVFGAATASEADIVTELANQGSDTLNFATLATDVAVRLDSTAVQAVHPNRTLKLSSTATFENVIGGAGNDTLIGNTLNNRLTGNAGNDTLYGLQGDDTLVGGLGNDTYVFAAATAAESDIVTESTNQGTDTLNFAALTTNVSVRLNSTAVQAVDSNRTLKLNSTTTFENVIGGAGYDKLIGNTLNNRITGNAGNDTIYGLQGNDTLLGGLGDDTYVFAAATAAEADIVTESANQGTDTLNFAALTTNISVRLNSTAVQAVHSNRTLKLNSTVTFENVIGGAGNDTLIGNTVANTLTGNAGNDTLNGGAGHDALLGGLGDDVYVFGPATSAEADTATEGTNGGVDTLNFSAITTSITFSLSTSAVQSVHTNRTLKLNSTTQFENIAGGSGNDILTGNSVANVLIGNAGNDQLTGNAGRDILIGGLGLDTLNGGADDDILIAGRTTHDALFSNLNALQAEWVSGNIYASRITSLRSGVSSPIVSLKAKTNVLNDSGNDDSLTGGTGTDWFFGAVDDVIADFSGEILDLL